MRITAFVDNSATVHQVAVDTDGSRQSLGVPPKASGPGSGVNGGEFLMLALATCYCNDLYREARRLGIPLDAVQVEASADFPGVGLAATDIRYRASVRSSAAQDDIARLLAETDAVAEVHNTLRAGCAVTFEQR
ncbi:OsmC family protein [Massilia sp. IC2-476]|uniref:OsmC family protein n=1 Tax=Massilia sp. IC2-476 TaxID=2887199 RepID=UPI001D0F64B6|nr:OsmC family protein [Massilia sp. IC2-476]MCC2974156.1 OsmC family protein [Massilia sp. IC2-476]